MTWLPKAIRYPSTKPPRPVLLAPAVILLGLLLFCALPVRPSQSMLNLVVGQNISSFALTDTTGKLISSDGLLGSPACLIFWSTWSPRSTEVLEDFKKYKSEFAEKNWIVLAINVDGENLSAERRAAVFKFAAAMNLPFPVLLDGDLSVFAALGVVAHPTVVVLDSAGRTTYILPGYPLSLREELKEAVKKTLGLPSEEATSAPAFSGYLPSNGARQLFNLGREMLNRGLTDKARRYFNQAAQRDPQFFDAAVMAARLDLYDGDTAQAETLVGRGAENFINRADVRYLKVLLLLHNGKTAEAAAVFPPLAEPDADEGWSLWGRGLVALAQNDYAAAAAAFEKASLLLPENWEVQVKVKALLTSWWLKGQTPPEEKRFLSVFPSLSEVKDKYRKILGGAGAN